MNPEKAEELSCILEDAISSLKSALEQLEGSGTRAEDETLILSEIIAKMEEEKGEYDCIIAEQDAKDLAALNREYERSLL